MKTKTQERTVTIPAFFVPNHGQYPQEVFFTASAKHTRFYFMKSYILHAMKLTEDESDGTKGVALSMGFVDANPDLSIQGARLYEGKVNYFIGNNSDEWKINIPTYGELNYNDVWKGISLTIHHTEKGIKLNWHIDPGTNPDAIRLICQGADSLSVSDDGSLVQAHRYGKVCEEAPVAYQMIDGQRVEVPCGYRLDGALSYGFWLGENYDSARELIIDPLLPYTTLLGGSGVDKGNAIAVDAEGCAYVTGETRSTDFPTTPGAFQTTLLDVSAIFITKFSADGNQLLYSTYLGGTSHYEQSGNAIAIDSTGHAYVTGKTSAQDFPVTPGAFQSSPGDNAYGDSYVTKLSPDGTSLVYSTYLSGNVLDVGTSIHVDAGGYSYVGGFTGSYNFPTTPGAYQTSLIGSSNAFLTKFSVDGTTLIYSTFLGNGSATNLWSLAVDAAGYAYVAGDTTSATFPVTPGAFQTTLNGTRNTFVTKFLPDGSGLVYSTFVGGSQDDYSHCICIDGQGNAYVTGNTHSTDFPVTPGVVQSAYGGGFSDAFLYKLSADASALVYSTYLGGNNLDNGNGIALASGNRACVTGDTSSPNFPTTPWVKPSTLTGSQSIFLTIISEDGASYVASSYIGGNNVSSGKGIAIGVDDNIYIAGTTNSSNFPVTPGAFQPTNQGGNDAFVYRTGFVKYAKASVVLMKL